MARLQFLSFTTNQDGFVSCPDFIKGWESTAFLSKIEESPLGKMFFQPSCKYCRHMKYDECYFESAEIREVSGEVSPFSLNPFSKWHKYRCDICGQSLSQTFLLLKKRYIKRKEGIDIPLICSSCYKHVIQRGNIDKKFVNSILLYGLTLFLPVFMVTLVTILYFLLRLYAQPNSITYAVLIIILDSAMGFVIYNYPVKRLRLLAHGKEILMMSLSNPAVRELMLK